MSKKTKSPVEFEVGYKKPPKQTQFKKGKSGNSKGRPKKSRNMVTLLNEELDQSILIQENGKSISLTKREAIVKRVVTNALNADMKAIATVLNMDAEREDPNAIAFEVTEHDKENLDRLINRLTKSGEK